MRTRHLVIVESPAKAETIGRFLGDDYLVEASYGHVRDLPRSAEERPASLKGKPWAELAVNVEQDFEPVYIVPPEKSRHVARLREELKRADKLLLATDEDREGESIGWHLVEVLEPTVPVERIVFHEVTRDAIAAAVQAPRQVDLNLVQAQESRRILDRLFGYSLSPLLWRKIQRGLSAGRVQSVAVRLLVQRERERARFHSAVYWDVEAALESAEGADRVSAEGRLDATLRRLGGDRMPTGRDFDPATGDLATPGARVLDEAAVQGLIQAVRQASWTVTKVDARPSAQRPAAPFTTSTLQQEAGNRLGFSAARAMQVAQGLYEGIDVGDERVGLITYMRTDSVTLAQQALGDAQRVIRARFGPEYGGEPRHYRTRTRNAQEAHEAIRPTEFQRTPEELRGSLSDDQYRLYDLIWRRALASQMPDARMERTVVEVSVDAPDGPAVFEARGRRILFPGFLQAYQDRLDEEPLPPVAVGDSVRPRALEAKRHETQPPARYTEASLVRKLEEEGLGRPSTYAAILSTIEDRGYVFKQDSALVPTFVAFAVTTLLERHFMHLVEPRFTAQLEETLDCIARGETDSVSHLREFYHGEDGRPGLQRRIEIEFPQIAFPLYEVGADPESEQPVVVRIGRFGPYLQRGEGGPGDTASIPADLAPADLTIAGALELLAAPAGRPPPPRPRPRDRPGGPAAERALRPLRAVGAGSTGGNAQERAPQACLCSAERGAGGSDVGGRAALARSAPRARGASGDG